MVDKIKSAFGEKNGNPELAVKDLSVIVAQKEHIVEPLKFELQGKLTEFNALLLQFKNGERGLSEDLSTLQKEMTSLRERFSSLLQTEVKEGGEEGFEKINKALEALADTGKLVYHSPKQINKKLKELGSSLAEHEILRMEAEFEKLSIEQVIEKCELLKEHTEGKKAPLLLILPREILIEGKPIPFTIENLDQENAEGIWKYWKKKKADLKVAYVNKNYISEELLQMQWGDNVVAFSSASLEGSKNKTYVEQEQYVKSKLGENLKIKADMYPAMILHYLITGELLIDYDFEGRMRLHEIGTDRGPLSVFYDVEEFPLDGDDASADSNAGIGSSFVFSSLLR